MSLTDSNKIKIFIASFSSWFLYILILFIFIELSAGIALKIYNYTQRGASDFSLISPDVRDELTTVQKNRTLNLYRWYNLHPNFNGDFVITDSSGFRIDPNSITDDEIIGMFGGSTTFSSFTNQQDSIPNQLSDLIPDKQVLNFGIGGYSSGAEIMTFIEALRFYPGIKYAIFYDGINELGRAFDKQKSNGLVNSYNLIGEPYFEGVRLALKNNSKRFSIDNSNIYYLYKHFFNRIFSGNKIFNREKFLKDIADLYFENVKVINAICIEYRVKCIFTWQPSIYSVADKSLSEEERIISNETPRTDYVHLTKIVLSDQRSKIFNLIDLTKVFKDKLPSERYFYDWAHINSEGNYLVAKILAKYFNKQP